MDTRIYKHCMKIPDNTIAVMKYIDYVKNIEFDLGQFREFIKQYDHNNIVHRTIGVKFGITKIDNAELIKDVMTNTKPKKYDVDEDIEYWIFLLLLLQQRIESIRLTFGETEFGKYVVEHYDKFIFI